MSPEAGLKKVYKLTKLLLSLMWNEIMKRFGAHPAQEKVVRLLLERGFQINDRGKVVSGGIEIPHTKISKEAGIDRRVVDATTQIILNDPLLKKVFLNLRSIAFLKDVAIELGFGVVVISPKSAEEVGILSDVSKAIAEYGISIRQAISDDPFFTENPKLTIVTDGLVPPNLVSELKKVNGVKSITIY